MEASFTLLDTFMNTDGAGERREGEETRKNESVQRGRKSERVIGTRCRMADEGETTGGIR